MLCVTPPSQHPTKGILCRTKTCEQFFNTIKKYCFKLGRGLKLKDLPKLDKPNNFTIIVFQLDEKRTCPPVLLSLQYKQKVTRGKDEEKKLYPTFERSHFCLRKYTYIGLSHCTNFCLKYLATKWNDIYFQKWLLLLFRAWIMYYEVAKRFPEQILRKLS